MKPVDASYIAGLLDGEGSIFISKNNPKVGYPYYKLVVVIYNTHEPTIRFIHSLCCGGVYRFRTAGTDHRGIKTNRDIWKWYIDNNEAKKFLRKVLPYLRIKKDQAKLALEFLNILKKGYGGFSTRLLSLEEVSSRDSFKNRISSLNHGREIVPV